MTQTRIVSGKHWVPAAYPGNDIKISWDGKIIVGGVGRSWGGGGGGGGRWVWGDVG